MNIKEEAFKLLKKTPEKMNYEDLFLYNFQLRTILLSLLIDNIEQDMDEWHEFTQQAKKDLEKNMEEIYKNKK